MALWMEVPWLSVHFSLARSHCPRVLPLLSCLFADPSPATRSAQPLGVSWPSLGNSGNLERLTCHRLSRCTIELCLVTKSKSSH